MKQIKLLLFVLGMVSFASSHAQTHPNIAAISWEVAFPTNSNYLDKTSWAGGRVEYRRMVNKQFSIGAAISWNSFEQYVGTKTYDDGHRGAVTTDMIREVYTLPITLTGHYYFQTDNKIFKPYVGIGLGGQYAEQNAYFNIYGLTSNNWGFVARPEVGALLQFGRGVAGLVGVSYNIATNKNDEFDINGLKQFCVNIGIAGIF
ncbi:OmpW family outer membrane protein [Danxiaibacter flavus]|uniref:OmpW family outer membrane protein n=1 Tax=Danxiaibacter flavus TaxID=3049108 RepID=A0ABV3ZAA3_9BACT|nr:OmpW family outer membrane protein [Chitinophagaceae bacterium DXS]